MEPKRQGGTFLPLRTIKNVKDFTTGVGIEKIRRDLRGSWGEGWGDS